MVQETTPVLIVGGGPAGLATALFLARKGIKPLLVERRPTTSPLPRATGVHARSMEVFRTAGVEPAIRDAGLRLVSREAAAAAPGTIPRVILRTRTLAELADAFVIEAGEETGDDLSPCDPAWCGQDLLEPILRAAAIANGADVRFGTELITADVDDDGVTALIEDRASGGRIEVRAGYLVAADGVYSPLRTRFGIRRSGDGVLQHMISVLFRADLSEVLAGRRFILTYIANPDVQCVLVGLDGKDRWMFWTSYDHEGGETYEGFTPDRVQELLRKAVGVPGPQFTIDGTFPWETTHLIADQYRVGRLFLVGDAAHTHPPHGGFGANAGMQDAHNLAWKLAAVLHGYADPELLDTYEAERKPVGRATADQALMRERFRATADEQEGFRDFPNVILGYRYVSTAVRDDLPPDDDLMPPELDLSGRPGTRVPHVWLATPDGGVSTVDLCDDAFVLLTEPGTSWPEAASRVADRLDVPLRVHTVGSADLSDPEGRWRKSCGVAEGGALLVRPDGFVAWRSADPVEDPEAALSQALEQILSRTKAHVGSVSGRAG